MNYYNENDKFAAAWLRELIKQELIPAGDVDERDIREVQPGDVAGYTQAHWFAGVAGWSEALRLAGWPADRAVWTGSCPCQPFSQAGDRRGVADERHLWPEFRRLIDQCRPPVVFGEQVASKDGRRWLAGVRADLEAMGHAAWAADLCAAGVGSPQMRQRLFWAARRLSDAGGGSVRSGGRGEAAVAQSEAEGDRSERQRLWPDARAVCLPRGLPYADSQGLEIRSIATLGSRTVRHEGPSSGPSRDRSGGVSDTQDIGRQPRPWPSDAIFAGRSPAVEPEGRGEVHSGVAHAHVAQLQRESSARQQSQSQQDAGDRFWADAEWFEGPDSKWRRLKHGLRILAHGVQGRVGKLRGYGGAIVPQVAAVFIQEADGSLADHGLAA